MDYNTEIAQTARKFMREESGFASHFVDNNIQGFRFD